MLALADAVGEETSAAGCAARTGLGRRRRSGRRPPLVEDFIANWDQHRAVLRTRNLAAQEGDQRFRDVRNERCGRSPRGSRPKVADAAGLGARAVRRGARRSSSMLERMAAFHADLEQFGTSPRRASVETTARILHHTATGE